MEGDRASSHDDDRARGSSPAASGHSRGEAPQASPAALQRALGNRRLARLAGASKEEQADRVALAALGLRGNRTISIADAVGAVTKTDLSQVEVRRERLPGAEGVARDGSVEIDWGADAQVLAHELAHVALGHDADGRAHYFTSAERPQIGNLDAIVADAQRMANNTSLLGGMRWGRFTAAAGGQAAGEIGERLVSQERTSRGDMRVRYLYTVRCGLVDMRHFYQLMYLGLTVGNASAVMEGREHELNAEASSRFAPEDTVSNALGALFGSRQSTFQRVSTFVSNLREFLSLCGPADWGRMTSSEQDTVVNYYSARTASGSPLHPSETATPSPPVRTTAAAAPTRGIYPFVFGVTGSTWNMYSDIVEP